MKTGYLDVGTWGPDGDKHFTIIRICPYCGYSDWLGDGPDHRSVDVEETPVFDTNRRCAGGGCYYEIESKERICEQLAARDDADSKILLKLIEEIGADRE